MSDVDQARVTIPASQVKALRYRVLSLLSDEGDKIQHAAMGSARADQTPAETLGEAVSAVRNSSQILDQLGWEQDTEPEVDCVVAAEHVQLARLFAEHRQWTIYEVEEGQTADGEYSIDLAQALLDRLRWIDGILDGLGVSDPTALTTPDKATV